MSARHSILTVGFQLQAVAEKSDLTLPSFTLSVTLNADTAIDQLWFPENPYGTLSSAKRGEKSALSNRDID